MASPTTAPASPQGNSEYWRANLRLIMILLSIWAFVSLGCDVLFIEVLNRVTLPGGLPLGFFMAQQGTAYVFILLIAVYVVMMGRYEDKATAQPTEGARP